jgi:transposase InsO family protein
MQDQHREAIAMFRYGLISEFIHAQQTRTERRARMREIAKQSYTVSWRSKTISVSMSSLSRWLSAYRTGGFPALRPKERSDKGVSKAIPQFLARRIIAIKQHAPLISIPEIIRSLEDAGEVEPNKLKLSTVHRLLQSRGLSGRPGQDPGKKQQRLPYLCKLPLDLWIGDVMHGRILVQDKKVYLIAFIDNATRAIMHASFRFDEGALSVLEVLREALMTRGICRRLYVDHGSAFIDERMTRTCAELGIHHMLAPVRDGAAKGPIERWFGTVRRQFECHLQEPDLRDLDTLNSLLWRWINSTYHQRVHSTLDGETPRGRFMRLLPTTPHQRVKKDFDFIALWRSRVHRTIRNDGTVRLHGHLLEVPPTITRNRVELRYLHELLPQQVEVWVADAFKGHALPVDLEANATRRRWRPKSPQTSTSKPQVDPLGRARRSYTSSTVKHNTKKEE